MSINYTNIKSGDLRNRITIEKPVHSTDSIGGQTPTTYTTFATVWGMVIPWKGNEKFFAEQTRMEIYHRVVIRYVDGITPDMRLKFTVGTELKTLQIKSIIVPNNQMRNFIEITCNEGMAS